MEERKSFPRASTAETRASEGGFRAPWVVARTTATLMEDERRLIEKVALIKEALSLRACRRLLSFLFWCMAIAYFYMKWK